MQNRKNAVIAGYVGNVIEWYDFALYGFMASILSQLFFQVTMKSLLFWQLTEFSQLVL